jgi:hypothetical protein
VIEKDSLFDDATIQIDELQVIIKHDVEMLRREIETLETQRQNITQFKRNNQSQLHGETIIQALRLRLADTAKAFGQTLSTRTKVCIGLIRSHFNTELENTPTARKSRYFDWKYCTAAEEKSRNDVTTSRFVITL